MNESQLERVKARVRREDGHLLWDKPRATDGYASMWADGKLRYVHVLVWEHHNGPVPKGLVVDHRCGVRHCVELSHLQATTRSQNSIRAAYRTRTGNQWT